MAFPDDYGITSVAYSKVSKVSRAQSVSMSEDVLNSDGTFNKAEAYKKEGQVTVEGVDDVPGDLAIGSEDATVTGFTSGTIIVTNVDQSEGSTTHPRWTARLAWNPDPPA